MPLHYGIFVSAPAVGFLSNLTSRQRRVVVDFIRGIGTHPSMAGDYVESDDVGRKIEVSVVDNYAVLWWVDHAAAEIKVVDIRHAG